MEMILDSYRRQITISQSPLVKLSLIDIQPTRAERTLVFLHGFGGQATDWRDYLRHFAPRNRVVALDLRGHGKSDKQLFIPAFEPEYGDWSRARHNRDAAAPMSLTGIGHYYDVAEGIRGSPKAQQHKIVYTMDLFVDELQKILTSINIGAPFFLIGHSLGGPIAATYASRSPEDVEKLVLINTPNKFQLKSRFHSLFNLHHWQFALVAPFVISGSSAAILQNIYIYALRDWEGSQSLQGLQVPILSIQTEDRFFTSYRVKRENVSASKRSIETQITGFVAR
ncbi:MAG: alpha/beta fold hydrolase [Anaerolineales bacterium]